jgi:hypothetical protein
MFRIRILVRPLKPPVPTPTPPTPPAPPSLSTPTFNKPTFISLGLLAVSEILSLSPTEANGIIDTLAHFIHKK